MNDGFYLKLKCAYCGFENNVSYPSNSGFYDFDCQNTDIRIEKVDIKTGKVLEVSDSCGPCEQINFICADFTTKRIENITEEDVVQAFEMETTASNKLGSIKRTARAYLKDLKTRI